MIDTKELRQLAQAATPGPWVSQGRYIGTPRHMSYIGEVRDQCGNWSDTEKSRADSAFIAAANPAAISELIDRLEAAEKERDALRAKIEAMEQQEPAMWANSSNIVSARINQERGTVGDQHTCAETKTAYHDAPLYAIPGAQPTPSVPEGWLRAIDEALVVTHLGVANASDTYEQAKNKLDSLIGFHVDVATDPAVNGGQKLVSIEPTPSVPTALLVAVADLVAQMEIVARAGFVDTPDDKDSCAAFCVAEGTWLELMSAVESLASALAAAPEAKP